MAVLIFFGFSLLILLAGFTMIGVTIYQWNQKAKIKKQEASEKLSTQQV